jgi:hypothetical protein
MCDVCGIIETDECAQVSESKGKQPKEEKTKQAEVTAKVLRDMNTFFFYISFVSIVAARELESRLL